MLSGAHCLTQLNCPPTKYYWDSGWHHLQSSEMLIEWFSLFFVSHSLLFMLHSGFFGISSHLTASFLFCVLIFLSSYFALQTSPLQALHPFSIFFVAFRFACSMPSPPSCLRSSPGKLAAAQFLNANGFLWAATELTRHRGGNCALAAWLVHNVTSFPRSG